MRKLLNIELYNETWFGKLPRTSQPLFDYNHPTLTFPEPQLTHFISLSDLNAETKTISPSPLIEKSDTDIISPPSPIVLSKSLLISDGLFFIRCTPKDTFKQRWFLVKMNHEERATLKMQPEATSDYQVTFLARHPADRNLYED